MTWKPTLLLAVGIAAMLAPEAAPAQVATNAMVALCRKLTDDSRRLQCYDVIAGGIAQPADTPEPAKLAQEWRTGEDRSPIDDSPQFRAMLMSSDGRTALILRCREHITEVLLMPPRLYAYDGAQVVARLNDLPASTSAWSASTDHQSIFAPNGAAFVEMLPDSGKLFIRASTQSAVVDATFLLGEVSPVKGRIGAACSSVAKPALKKPAPVSAAKTGQSGR